MLVSVNYETATPIKAKSRKFDGDVALNINSCRGLTDIAGPSDSTFLSGL